MAESEYQRMRREREERIRRGKEAETRTGPRGKVKRDPEVAKQRHSEKVRRYQEAVRRATLVLKERFPREWNEILAAERRGVDAERGPLPGDESEAPGGAS